MKEFWMNTASHAMTGFDFMMVLYWFLASIAVLVILRKTGLLSRTAKWHRVLVCLYYIYIPAVFIGCGALWSSVHSFDYTIRQNLTEARATIIQSSVDYTGSAWKKVLSIFNKNPGISPKDMCLALTREYTDEILAGLNTSKYTMFLAPVVSGLKEGVAVSLAKVLEEKVISSVSGSTSVDKELLKTLWSRDIVEAMRGGLVFDLIFNQVQRVVAPLYAKVKMLFAMLMLPVMLEILLALYLRRKAQKASRAAMQ